MIYLTFYFKRKETLLPEFIREKEGKANAFIDRRFGEDDKNLSLEDKMLLRFKKEKQVKSYLTYPLSILTPLIEKSQNIRPWGRAGF